MVGMLMIVILGVEFTARPESWYWLTGPLAEEDGRRSNDSKDAPVPLQEEPLPPGAFRLAAAVPAAEPAENSPRVVDADPARLDPELVAGVHDNSLGIRNDESAAYYKILAQARRFSQTELDSAAADHVTFAQMNADPDDFRGRLITLRGRLKRLTPIPALENDFGIETVYEAWIVTPDSGSDPILLHFTEIADGTPTGMNLDVGCRFTGYFFKKYAFVARDGLHITTMLLGKRLEGLPVAAKTPEFGLAPYIVALAVFMGSVLVFAVWRYSVGDRRFRRAHLARIQQATHSIPADLDISTGGEAEVKSPDA